MMMRFKKGRINETRNYKLFGLNDLNRNVDKSKKKYKDLVKSMSRYGWWDDEPMSVIENGNGKFKIKKGHHRFVAAMELGIPVKFIISDKDVPIYEMEQFNPIWGLRDFLDGYSKQGRPEYAEVKRYHERTGINISDCIALLGGESAGSHNKNNAFKKGKFTLGNLAIARRVERIVTALRDRKIEIASHSNFVKAISYLCWLKEFDPERLIKKIKSHSYMLHRQPTVDDYLTMLEAIYNRQSKDKVPIGFFAKEAAQERQKARF